MTCTFTLELDIPRRLPILNTYACDIIVIPFTIIVVFLSVKMWTNWTSCLSCCHHTVVAWCSLQSLEICVTILKHQH